MKKKLIPLFLTISLFLGFSFSNAQEVVLSYKIHSEKYILDGAMYEIMGEVTNNSGQMVKGITINLNYFDANGKKLVGSNYLEDYQKGSYSDKQAPTTDYLAKVVTVPFRYIRSAEKISGKLAKSEVVFTARVVKAPTCAIIENVKTEKLELDGGVPYTEVAGQIKCTAGKVFSGYAIIAGYDDSGKIIQISDFVIDGAEELATGQSQSFEFKFWENGLKFAKVKVFPSYRGDWDEE